ncbi:MAG: WD40 repeat domain-containing protein [Pirellulaceae bacterium]
MDCIPYARRYRPRNPRRRALWRRSSRSAAASIRSSVRTPRDSPVDCLAVSADGKYLVSGAQDHTVKLWIAGTGKCLRTMIGHSAPVTCVRFTRDGQGIVSGSMDLTLKLWDFATGHVTLSMPAHTAPVTSLAFAPEGEWFVTGGVDATIKFWDASAASTRGGLAFPPDVPEDRPE